MIRANVWANLFVEKNCQKGGDVSYRYELQYLFIVNKIKSNTENKFPTHKTMSHLVPLVLIGHVINSIMKYVIKVIMHG